MREEKERVMREVEMERERTSDSTKGRGVEGEAEASSGEREAKVVLGRAQELVEEGSLEEAIRLLNSCLRLNPKEYDAWSLRNDVTIKLSRRRREEERRDAERKRSERTKEWMESGWKEEMRKRREKTENIKRMFDEHMKMVQEREAQKEREWKRGQDEKEGKAEEGVTTKLISR